ncbi:MAG: hypothetical protein AW07_00404 [Candidatus Accumulibacter sp. SK-11]|nr:MAG: hypothetical protein AW07_00404 [Candidatus Accumulibacter sp. SK-11]
MGDLVDADLTAVGGLEVANRTQDEVDLLDHMHRQADRPRLVHDRALDALANPPGGVSREAKTALGIELLDGVNQAEIPLLDHVQQWQTAVQVMFGDVDHQPQVVLDHLLPRQEVPGTRTTCPGCFLGGREERLCTDLVEVMLRHVVEQFSLGRRQRIDDFG